MRGGYGGCDEGGDGGGDVCYVFCCDDDEVVDDVCFGDIGDGVEN